LKQLLIVSPYFPPTNAADMHRIRMSLPYFEELGWEAEIVTVGPAYSDLPIDNLLINSIPNGTIIHSVRAFPKWLTSKIGLGSIAIRSIWFYRQKVNGLLKKKNYDLIYFSTTQFPVCILGQYWKKKFGIPYVIDMQDPWHSDYYKDKPKHQRPTKYWFSYRLNKWLEPIAMKQVGGLISVSQAYIDDLKTRYPVIKEIPAAIVTFGAFKNDLEVAKLNADRLNSYVKPEIGKINIVYIGRGGHDMLSSIKLLFLALKKGLSLNPTDFKKYHLYFIGTSYATQGEGSATIYRLAETMGLKGHVTEMTDRVSFYDSLVTLMKADILFLPGSDDVKYTASKIFQYIVIKKPTLAIFNEKSSAVNIIRQCSPSTKLITLPGITNDLVADIYLQLATWTNGNLKPTYIDQKAFAEFSAEAVASKQTNLFDRVINE
jgi:hypothetical protein